MTDLPIIITQENLYGGSTKSLQEASALCITQRNEGYGYYLGMSANKKVLICAVGIFICYFYFGILQEKITRSTYGENEKFSFSLSLVFILCVVNTLFAKILLHTFMKHGEDNTKTYYYAVTGFSYLSAMVSSNMALRHVSYPTQVVGKSCKPIPVMILGVLLGRKKYPLVKYFFVFMIVIGVCIFMYKDKPSVADENDSWLGVGEMLLLISLALDGVIGVMQERMRAEHETKPAHMMYGMNLWPIWILGVELFGSKTKNLLSATMAAYFLNFPSV